MNNLPDFSMDDIYFKDAFTSEGENLNLEVNELTVDCISSKSNNFSIDEDGNISANSISLNGSFNDAIGSLIYPVGSIYLSVNSTNPSTIFGGTWEQIKDRFLLGAGDTYQAGVTGGSASVNSGGPSSNSTGAASGNTGAASGNTGSTTLDISQIPAHAHKPEKGNDYGYLIYKQNTNITRSRYASGTSGGYTHQTPTQANLEFAATTISQGGGGAHAHTLNNHVHSLNSHTHTLNNHTHGVATMPPYITVYMWKRVA